MYHTVDYVTGCLDGVVCPRKASSTYVPMDTIEDIVAKIARLEKLTEELNFLQRGREEEANVNDSPFSSSSSSSSSSELSIDTPNDVSVDTPLHFGKAKGAKTLDTVESAFPYRAHAIARGGDYLNSSSGKNHTQVRPPIVRRDQTNFLPPMCKQVRRVWSERDFDRATSHHHRSSSQPIVPTQQSVVIPITVAPPVAALTVTKKKEDSGGALVSTKPKRLHKRQSKSLPALSEEITQNTGKDRKESTLTKKVFEEDDSFDVNQDLYSFIKSTKKVDARRPSSTREWESTVCTPLPSSTSSPSSKKKKETETVVADSVKPAVKPKSEKRQPSSTRAWESTSSGTISEQASRAKEVDTTRRLSHSRSTSGSNVREWIREDEKVRRGSSFKLPDLLSSRSARAASVERRLPGVYI